MKDNNSDTIISDAGIADKIKESSLINCSLSSSYVVTSSGSFRPS